LDFGELDTPGPWADAWNRIVAVVAAAAAARDHTRVFDIMGGVAADTLSKLLDLGHAAKGLSRVYAVIVAETNAEPAPARRVNRVG
jgi:hypothetical protein